MRTRLRRAIVELVLHVGLIGGLLAGIAAGWLPPSFGLLALWVVAVSVFWTVKDRLPEVLMVFAVVFAVMTIAMSRPPRVSRGFEDLPGWYFDEQSFDRRLPAVIHLVFDEMMSPGAIDDELPDGPAMRAALYRIGERFGLRTFDAVYSRAYFTSDSLQNLVNGEWLGRTGLSDRIPANNAVRRNAYFDTMAAAGYRIVVFQSSLLDFCVHDTVSICETFPSFDPGVVKNVGLGRVVRAMQLLDTLLRAYEPSYLARYGQRALSVFGRTPEQARELGLRGRFDVQGFPWWMDRITRFIGSVHRGTLVFGHFLVPHGPYLLSGQCEPGNSGEVGYYLGRRFPDPARRAEARRRYFGEYFDQMSCAITRIEALLQAVATNPELHDAIVVIHGDHGSRISVGNLAHDLEREDFIANFGTYFAVRRPDLPPGRDCRQMSLAEAVRTYVSGSRPPDPIDRPRPPVVLKAGASDAFVETPMPLFGCAATNGSL